MNSDAALTISWGKVAEKRRVCSRGHPLENPQNVGEEAHVEHAVGFVEDEHRRLRQIDVTALRHVHHATGRSDDDVHARVELLGLLLDVRATVDGLHAQPGFALSASSSSAT